MTPERKNKAPRYLTGLFGMTVSVYFMVTQGENPTVLFASAFFLLICATDTLKSEIPNLATLVLLLTGFAYNFMTEGAPGLIFAVSGMLLGFALFIIPYAMGGMGAGDVKALASLGALLGVTMIFQVFLYTALFGGVMAILHFALNRNLAMVVRRGISNLGTYLYTRDPRCIAPAHPGEPLRFPYATAIALGFFTHISWGGPL